MPQLVHGGPGRAGGGEEMGGVRGVLHYMQRTAIQGSPLTCRASPTNGCHGADELKDRVHPFRKYFEELEIGETLHTHRRTVTESDVVSFAGISGDFFYVHMDDIAARRFDVRAPGRARIFRAVGGRRPVRGPGARAGARELRAGGPADS